MSGVCVTPHSLHSSSTPAILLRHLKLPAEAIKQAVLACDHSVLGEQHIRLMAAFAPDKKEVEPTWLCGCGLYLPYLLQCLGLARYYDNTSILGLPDQFSCEVTCMSPFHTVVIPNSIPDEYHSLLPGETGGHAVQDTLSGEN